MEAITLLIILVLGLGFLAYLRWRDNRYLKRKTKDALGENLKKEIEEERSLYYRNQERFEKALERNRQKREKPQKTETQP